MFRKITPFVALLAVGLMAGKCSGPMSAGPGVCPALKSYSQEFRDQLANEIDAVATTYPAVRQVLTDYEITRKDIRSCIARAKAPLQ